MRRLEHCNIVKLKYFFYSSGEKVIMMLKCCLSPMSIDTATLNNITIVFVSDRNPLLVTGVMQKSARTITIGSFRAKS